MKPVLAALALLIPVTLASAQDSGAWRDPSAHRVQLVTVEDGVRLEVLDWGRSGRPLVLLAGSGSTAHVFDGFAEKLIGTGHVYGITRRGFGVSSHPPSGYDDQRLADDVVQVIRLLGITKPVLVGHSMAGGELTTVASRFPDLPSALVYLDAGADPSDLPILDPAMRVLYDRLPPSIKDGQQPSVEELRTFQGYRDFQTRVLGFAFPESELRNIFDTNADGTRGRYRTAGTVSTQIGEGQQKRDYTGIRAPILAFFAGEPPVHPPADTAGRAAVKAYQTAKAAFTERWKSQMRRARGSVRIVHLADASHFVFFSNQADVLREVRQFVAGLP